MTYKAYLNIDGEPFLLEGHFTEPKPFLRLVRTIQELADYD
jgi:hypothetical protein